RFVGSAEKLGASSVQVDAIAAHRHSFLEQQLALALSFRNGSVRADDSMPRQSLMRRRQHAAHEARRCRIDVSVGLHRTYGNVSNPVDDLGDSRLAPGTSDAQCA